MKHVTAQQDLEVEAIGMFINFLRLIGLPKSVGEIYGLLFVAPRPMACMEARLATVSRRPSTARGSWPSGSPAIKSAD